MRSFSFVLATLLSLTLVACGGDDGGDGGNVGTNGENIGGTVVDESGPIEGATVSLVGASTAVATTTNANGQWALLAPAGAPQILAEANGYWGSVVRRRLADGQTIDDIDLELVADADVQDVAGALSRTVSKTDVIIALSFYVDGGTGGESAALQDSSGSPLASDPPFTFDSNEDPVESTTILIGPEAELIFTGVSPGEFEVFADGTASTGCSAEFDGPLDGYFQAIAGAIVDVEIFCGPI